MCYIFVSDMPWYETAALMKRVNQSDDAFSNKKKRDSSEQERTGIELLLFISSEKKQFLVL